MEMHAHVPKIGKTLGHWLLEGLFIVISVALGFWVTQVREERQSHELAARVLTGLQAEVQHNLATLEPFIDIQQKWIDAMGKFGSSTDRQTEFPVCPTSSTACGMFFATRPDLGDIKTNFPIFRRAAWDTALSTGALRLRGLRSRCRTVRDLPDAGSLQEQPGEGWPVFDGLVRPGRPRCGSSQDVHGNGRSAIRRASAPASALSQIPAPHRRRDGPWLNALALRDVALDRTSWREVHRGTHACRNGAAGVAAPNSTVRNFTYCLMIRWSR